MDFNIRKFASYVISVLALSGIGLVIYDMFELKEFHTEKVKIFCDLNYENVGITNTRSLSILKYYVNNRSKYEESEPFKIENFIKDTIHLDRCIPAELFSKRYNGARSVKVMLDGEEKVITVLTENITFTEERGDY